MFCSHCGTRLPKDSLACYKCGVQFNKQTPAAQTIVVKSGSNAAVWIIAVLAILAICGYVGWKEEQRQNELASLSIGRDGSMETRVNVPPPAAPAPAPVQSAPLVQDSSPANVDQFARVCSMPNDKGERPRAICNNGSISYYTGDKEFTCLLKGGVKHFCY